MTKSPDTIKDDKMRTLTTGNAKDGMTIAIQYLPSDHYRLVEQDGRTYAIPIRPSLSPKYIANRLYLGDVDRGRWVIVKDAPEPPLVSLDPQNPPELPIGHVDRPDCVLQGWMPIVDEMMDAMDALSKTVNLSPDEGELFDSVTGILLMLKQLPIICAVSGTTGKGKE